MSYPKSCVALLAAMLTCVGAPAWACQFCNSATQHATCPWGASSDSDTAEDETDGASAYRTQGSGWTTSSAGETRTGLGEPIQLTWSVVPDGTQLPRGLSEPSGNSDLVAFLDQIHHGGNSPGGSDLTQRAWWGLINSAFERWDQVSGVTFNYEPNDDGHYVYPSTTASTNDYYRGIEGVRGDHRLGGHYIDGDVRPSNLAYNYFPSHGSDMVIDTSESTIFGNSEDNYLRFRNTLTHEIGHGLGLAHVESSDTTDGDSTIVFGTFLMEPTLSVNFDGPQYDDILGIQRLYGDAYEKGDGNDTAATATDLGTLSFLSTLAIGTDADDEYVDPTQTDFVSVDDNSDTDYYLFSVNSAQEISIVLEPKGPTYLEGRQGSANNGTQQTFDTKSLSDLSLALVGPDGTTLLAAQNTVGRGITEAIEGFQLTQAGDYYVRVTGATNAAQMYQLSITSVPEASSATLLALGLCGSLLWRRRWA